MSYTYEQLATAVAKVAAERDALVIELADMASTMHAARLRIEEAGAALTECMEARRTLLVTVDEMRAEENASYELVARQGDLLTGVVNALRGNPPPDTSWSHHDAAELAQKAVIRIAGLEALLKGINDTDNDRVAPAEFNVACACGHAPEEHGHVPGYPGLYRVHGGRLRLHRV